MHLRKKFYDEYHQAYMSFDAIATRLTMKYSTQFLLHEIPGTPNSNEEWLVHRRVCDYTVNRSCPTNALIVDPRSPPGTVQYKYLGVTTDIFLVFYLTRPFPSRISVRFGMNATFTDAGNNRTSDRRE